MPEVYDIGPIAVPRLTCREARRLGRRVVAARGSADPETLALAADARDMLVRANLALAVHLGSRRSALWGLPRDEMVSEAAVGLVKAAIEWEPDREPSTRFGTFAYWKILGSLTVARRRWSPVERLPDGRIVYRSGATPARDEDDPGDFGEPAAPTVAPPDLDPAPDHAGRVGAMLARVTHREREAVARRFGLDGHAEHTLSMIGRAMGFSKERARQLVASGLARMARTTPDAIRDARPPSSRDPSVREALAAFLGGHAHLSTREAARAFREMTGSSVGHEAVRLIRARGEFSQHGKREP